MQNRYWEKLIKKQFYGLSSNDFLSIRRKVGAENLKRMQIFTIITFFIQVLLIPFVDIPSVYRSNFGGEGLGAGESPGIPMAFMLLHILLALNMIIGFLGTKYFSKRIREYDNSIRQFEVLFFVVGVITLLLMTGIAALDQLRSGDISSYALNCLLVAAFLYMIPPVNLFVFIPPYVTLIIGILMLQNDVMLRTTYLTNSSAFFITMMILSTVLFKAHLKQLSDERLLEIANRKLDELALKDQLTGLANRRYFSMIFDREMARIQREGGSSYIAILDIDHFKTVNDSFGHPIGDCVLMDISQLLKNSIRETDLAARWGGEEFIILLTDIDDDIAIEIMERIRSSIEQRQLETVNAVICYTASIGIAKVRSELDNPLHEVYSRADSALYSAKTQGRNRSVISSE